MVALSQVRVSTPIAASARVCRGGASGGERDLVVVGGQFHAADAVKLLEGPCGGEVLVFEVGIANVCCGESLGDERLHQSGVHTDRDVTADSFLGPVSQRS